MSLAIEPSRTNVNLQHSARRVIRCGPDIEKTTRNNGPKIKQSATFYSGTYTSILCMLHFTTLAWLSSRTNQSSMAFVHRRGYRFSALDLLILFLFKILPAPVRQRLNRSHTRPFSSHAHVYYPQVRAWAIGPLSSSYWGSRTSTFRWVRAKGAPNATKVSVQTDRRRRQMEWECVLARTIAEGVDKF